MNESEKLKAEPKREKFTVMSALSNLRNQNDEDEKLNIQARDRIVDLFSDEVEVLKLNGDERKAGIMSDLEYELERSYSIRLESSIITKYLLDSIS